MNVAWNDIGWNYTKQAISSHCLPIRWWLMVTFMNKTFPKTGYFLFCAILFRIWKAKSSSQMCAFFYRMFANSARANNDVVLRSWTFFSTKLKQICRRMLLAYQDFSKHSQFGFFLEIYLGFLDKNFFKIGKCGNFFKNASQTVLLLKIFQKVQKLGVFLGVFIGFFSKNSLKIFKIARYCSFF